MIEATVKSLAGKYNKRFQSLVGCRVSITDKDSPAEGVLGCITVGCILKTKKGSRMRKERYSRTHFCNAVLEDIVVDEYGED